MPPSLIVLAATPAVAPRTIGLIVAVAVLGAVALFLLLPQPRRFLVAGGLLGLAALVAAGFLAGPTSFTPEVFLFYVFSAIAVASGCLLVTQRNPARAALSFALVVLSSCGLFLLLAAPFLMAATIIVYGGAIIVTFLFVLMLAQQEGPSDADYRSYEPVLACIGGFVLLGVLLYVIAGTYSPAAAEALDHPWLDQAADAVRRTDPALAAGLPPAEAAGTLNDADQFLGDFHDWLTALGDRTRPEEQGQVLPDDGKPLDDAVLNAQVVVRGEKKHAQDGQPVNWAAAHDALAQVQAAGRQVRSAVGMAPPPAGRPLSDYSGPAANVPADQIRRDAAGRPALPAENVAYLGRSLFTDYLLAVELGGTLLLVATIGAIAIATRRAEKLP